MLSHITIIRRSLSGKMKKADFIYNENEDILYIGDMSKTAKYSLSFRDIFIIDFDLNNKVIGIEILDASEIIYGFSKKVLKNIKEAYITAQYKDDLIIIAIKLISTVSTQPLMDSIQIPIHR